MLKFKQRISMASPVIGILPPPPPTVFSVMVITKTEGLANQFQSVVCLKQDQARMEIAASLTQLKPVQKQIMHMISTATSYQHCCNQKLKAKPLNEMETQVSGKFFFSASLLIAAYEYEQIGNKEGITLKGLQCLLSGHFQKQKRTIYIYKRKVCGTSYIQLRDKTCRVCFF